MTIIRSSKIYSPRNPIWRFLIIGNSSPPKGHTSLTLDTYGIDLDTMIIQPLSITAIKYDCIIIAIFWRRILVDARGPFGVGHEIAHTTTQWHLPRLRLRCNLFDASATGRVLLTNQRNKNELQNVSKLSASTCQNNSKSKYALN